MQLTNPEAKRPPVEAQAHSLGGRLFIWRSGRFCVKAELDQAQTSAITLIAAFAHVYWASGLFDAKDGFLQLNLSGTGR